MPSIKSAANTAAKLDLIDFTGNTLLLPNTTTISGNTTMSNNVTLGANGIYFSDGSQQTQAGASPGLAVAMSIVFGGS